METCEMCLMQRPDVAALAIMMICDKCAERLYDELTERVARFRAEMENWND